MDMRLEHGCTSVFRGLSTIHLAGICRIGLGYGYSSPCDDESISRWLAEVIA